VGFETDSGFAEDSRLWTACPKLKAFPMAQCHCVLFVNSTFHAWYSRECVRCILSAINTTTVMKDRPVLSSERDAPTAFNLYMMFRNAINVRSS
jgi:hypothetical protein